MIRTAVIILLFLYVLFPVYTTDYIPEQNNSLYFGISRTSRLMEYIEEIDLFLETLRNSPDMEAIISKYLGESFR